MIKMKMRSENHSCFSFYFAVCPVLQILLNRAAEAARLQSPILFVENRELFPIPTLFIWMILPPIVEFVEKVENGFAIFVGEFRYFRPSLRENGDESDEND
jgi:hypothetical protein